MKSSIVLSILLSNLSLNKAKYLTFFWDSTTFDSNHTFFFCSPLFFEFDESSSYKHCSNHSNNILLVSFFKFLFFLKTSFFEKKNNGFLIKFQRKLSEHLIFDLILKNFLGLIDLKKIFFFIHSFIQPKNYRKIKSKHNSIV